MLSLLLMTLCAIAGLSGVASSFANEDHTIAADGDMRLKRHLKPAFLRLHANDTEPANPSPHKHRHSHAQFVLKCPQMDGVDAADIRNLTVAWLHNGSSWFSVLSGSPVVDNSSITWHVKKWKTSTGFDSFIATDQSGRYKVEYEEARKWFVLRIQHVKHSRDEGLWTCDVDVETANKETMRFQSRKWLWRSIRTSGRVEYVRKRSSDNVPMERRKKEADADGRELGVFMFSKPDSEFATFQRISRYRDVAYIRNGDIVGILSHQERNLGDANNVTESTSSSAVCKLTPNAILISATFVIASFLVY